MFYSLSIVILFENSLEKNAIFNSLIQGVMTVVSIHHGGLLRHFFVTARKKNAVEQPP